LKSGDIAIDATAGNGHDTVFLAERVGSSGRVYAFDIQPVAIEKTEHRLRASGCVNVWLICGSHADLDQCIPAADRGHVAAIMFNLGYLPGGDKSIATDEDSTRSAIDQASRLIRPGGRISIVAYTGHDGGSAEALSVERIIDELSEVQFEVRKIESQPGLRQGPRLFEVIRKM
jgi:16S rRNA C1402 N4-methylase RsmH